MVILFKLYAKVMVIVTSENIQQFTFFLVLEWQSFLFHHILNLELSGGLESLKNLQQLLVDHNQLISTKGLCEVPTLIHLDCSFNHLAQVEGIENCGLLQVLKLQGNNLQEVKALNLVAVVHTSLVTVIFFSILSMCFLIGVGFFMLLGKIFFFALSEGDFFQRYKWLAVNCFLTPKFLKNWTLSEYGSSFIYSIKVLVCITWFWFCVTKDYYYL